MNVVVSGPPTGSNAILGRHVTEIEVYRTVGQETVKSALADASSAPDPPYCQVYGRN
jgi:hypothetical protein